MDQTHDELAEKAVLACCLHSALARGKTRDALAGGDFYEPLHEELWDAMNRLDRQDMAVDGPSLLAVVNAAFRERAARLLPDLVTYPVAPESVDTHCAHVRQWAQKRRLWAETLRCQAEIIRDNVDIVGLAASTATRFAAIRDDGASTHDAIQSTTVEELLLEVDEEPDWVIPGFLERGDRFILTGEEGLGKSYLLRQIVICAHAGLDPFTGRAIEPVNGMVFDFENSRRQIRRKLGAIYGYAANHGRGNAGQAAVLPLSRMDITSDRVLNMIHRELDHRKPDVIAIGPLYKMSPKALQTDDEAGPVLAALDTIRDRGIAMLIEAHAGNGMSTKTREWRPRGSSALRGWPEFGYGIKASGPTTATLIPWRGDRDERSFPLGLMQQNGLWVEQRAITVQDYWRGKEDWSDLAQDPE